MVYFYYVNSIHYKLRVSGYRDLSATSTPTARSPSPESELSGYGSASSFGYRMPEKLQIVKPMEGSATLHHWQRLATPHMAGIFEERDGVQIKHEQPLNDLDSTTYSMMDVEEEGAFDNVAGCLICVYVVHI